MQDYIIRELIETLKMFDRELLKFKPKPPEPEAVEIGMEKSKQVCAQGEYVFTSPYSKNGLVIFGDVKQYIDPKTKEWSTERLTCDQAAKGTKFGSHINDIVKACLREQGNKERTEYNDTIDVLDPDHYFVDCCNQNKFEGNFWDIQPGQAKQRAETLKRYERPTASNINDAIKLILTDRVFQGAIRYVLSRYPFVKAVDSIEDQLVIPYTTHDSNSGYKEFLKLNKATKDDQRTLGTKIKDYIMRETKGLTDKNAIRRIIREFCVIIVWARNQRGKGRAIEAFSAYVNMLINALEAPEIRELKELPEYVGLRDDLTQRETQIKQAEFAKSIGYVMGNWDQSGFDWHISLALLAIAGAMRYMKCNGSLSKELCLQRFLANAKAYIIDGANNYSGMVYGRTFSGYIDTMGNNTIINFLVDVYSNMLADPEYSTKVLYPSKGYHGLYLGDDDLSIHKPGIDKQTYVDTCQKLGLEVNNSKYAFGSFFLQYRLFKDGDGYHFVYAWPRVLRSIFSKENKKNLGPVGWSVATWQQLAKLIDYKPALIYALNIVLPLDKDRLNLDKDINWIKAQIQEEDRIALEKDPKAISTSQKLWANNPQQSRQFNENGTALNYDYFAEVQSKLRDAVVPNFWEKHGFKTPDVNKVK